MTIAAVVADVVQQHIPNAQLVGDGEYSAPCPLHNDRSPSFFLNRRTGLWICHAGCGSGTLPYLLKLLGYSRRQTDRYLEPIRDELKRARDKPRRLKATSNPFIAEYALPEAHLGCYEYFDPPPYINKLLDAGFDSVLLEDYDVGFDRNNDRITFPVRDLYGSLAGISGRATLSDQEPKYKFYSTELEEHYPGYSFKRSRYLWNGDRVYPALIGNENVSHEKIVIVEGFKACLWMIQSGFPNTVATMGSALSTTQAAILHRIGLPIILFMDNDRAGHEKNRQALKQLWGGITDIREVEYPSSEFAQPDDFEEDAICELIGSAVPVIPRQRRGKHAHVQK